MPEMIATTDVTMHDFVALVLERDRMAQDYGRLRALARRLAARLAWWAEVAELRQDAWLVTEARGEGLMAEEGRRG